jgi:hypothetical protein
MFNNVCSTQKWRLRISFLAEFSVGFTNQKYKIEVEVTWNLYALNLGDPEVSTIPSIYVFRLGLDT